MNVQFCLYRYCCEVPSCGLICLLLLSVLIFSYHIYTYIIMVLHFSYNSEAFSHLCVFV
jgi:hypothetical protein